MNEANRRLEEIRRDILSMAPFVSNFRSWHFSVELGWSHNLPVVAEQRTYDDPYGGDLERKSRAPTIRLPYRLPAL